MMSGEFTGNLNAVYTVTANCHDCYRCVRVCPVKAISVRGGQASIRDELCIKCGTCVRECPQHAKMIRSSLEQVKQLIASPRKVAASVAPSFAALFEGWRALRLPSALRRLGFDYVSETAEGAELVTERAFDPDQVGSITTACPAVVNYIEKYRPDYVDQLTPVASPMIAHGRMLKKRLGDGWAVVFIGPCAAKKAEAARPENAGVIDAVLTFAELTQWLEEERIDLASCPESGFQNQGGLTLSRLFPLPGGMLKTAGRDVGGADRNIVQVIGAEEVKTLFDLPARDWDFDMAECLFCADGCLNGPGMPNDMADVNYYRKKKELMDYTAGAPSGAAPLDQSLTCAAGFKAAPVKPAGEEEADEAGIQRVLENTGKGDPEQQMNCGACGYKSCRDNAIAVLKGMAEPEMCMPYMRRLAQQRTDKIIESSPNGVVILDENLHIIKTNPAFLKMFMTGPDAIGRRISCYMDADGFEKLASGAADELERIRSKYGMRYHEQLYAMREDRQYVGMFTDISNVTFGENQLDLIKMQTLDQAQELLDHQIKFSQEMAHFLGRSTAKSEELVKKMVELYEQKNEAKP